MGRPAQGPPANGISRVSRPPCRPRGPRAPRCSCWRRSSLGRRRCRSSSGCTCCSRPASPPSSAPSPLTSSAARPWPSLWPPAPRLLKAEAGSRREPAQARPLGSQPHQASYPIPHGPASCPDGRERQGLMGTPACPPATPPRRPAPAPVHRTPVGRVKRLRGAPPRPLGSRPLCRDRPPPPHPPSWRAGRRQRWGTSGAALWAGFLSPPPGAPAAPAQARLRLDLVGEPGLPAKFPALMK